VFVPLDDFALDRLDYGHDGWWRRLLGMFSATREQRADQKDWELDQTVRLHGFYSFDCAWASTNHSSLSTPRETSVNKSAVSASPALAAVSMAARVVVPNFASALDNEETCLCPDVRSSG